ncbi:AraC family transcriptional regulator [Paenibacillus thalictri]|uniref:AraC family transcriptional regulator n=1 Tax=Paenibacillus thalictri TaxID=2527873 RepID=A0A4Q9DCH7_9BACL|nr:AraC family transcriptional regulator [Paenibacillus thalictri]TBL68214.1 AraC family transcriptional regulator [Paenibacillus thalictri]
MKIMNYLNLNQHPIQLSFMKDRTYEFSEVYHAHQGMEILYVNEGRGRVIVEQQFFELRPGSLICFRPFQLHRIQMDITDEQPYIRSLFVFEPEALTAYLSPYPSLSSFFQRLWKDPLLPQVLSGLPVEDMYSFLQASRFAIDLAAAGELLEEQAFFLVSLLHKVKARWTETALAAPVPSSKPSTTAEKMMQWLEAHYMEPFELGKLAEAVHLSPSHVSAAFRQAVGSSITEYLAARRIRQACVLLKTTAMSVEDIGHAVGLGNVSYFCQLFKRNVGESPHRFRRTLFSK